jgi:cyclic pyranopterin phosphate synthase
MAENMTFRPKQDVLTLEELDCVCSVFVERGIRKIRLTGGEPLVRKNIMSLVRSLSRHLEARALDELTLTTNGSQLSRHASELYDCGVCRVNVSLDTLRPDRFRAIKRWGDFERTLTGIHSALAAGLKVKINLVALRDRNDDEFEEMIAWGAWFGHGRDTDRDHASWRYR